MIINCKEKRVINRRLNYYLIIFFRQTHHSEVKSIDNSRSERHPFFLRFPLMMTFQPIHNRFKISVLAKSVTINISLCSFYHGFTYKICRREIHIGNPHRDNVIFTKDILSQIILNTLSISTVYYLVEIVFHN